MAEMVGLMDSEIYQVWDQQWGKKELCTANYMARGSAKDLHYFWVMSPLKSPKIMGLRGTHSPEALKHQARLLFSPWCGNEGQNKGTMVNHWALPSGTDLQEVPITFHNYFKHNVTSHTGM